MTAGLVAELERICGASQVLDRPRPAAHLRVRCARPPSRPPGRRLPARLGGGGARTSSARATRRRRPGSPAARDGSLGRRAPGGRGRRDRALRLRRILEVDLPNARVTVEPGVTNLGRLPRGRADALLPPDPSSQVVCTVGGNVAENSGGAHCFKYGFTTNYVTGLEVVLPGRRRGRAGREGGRSSRPRPARRVRRLGGDARRRDAITLRVVPVPERSGRCRVLRPWPPRADGLGHRRGGGSCRARSRSWTACRCRGRAGDAGRQPGRGALPYRRAGRPGAECDPRLDAVVALCEAGGAPRDPRRGSDAERELIWQRPQGRVRGHGPDLALLLRAGLRHPRTPPREVLGRIEELAAEYGLRVANVFHAGDGNLHPLVAYDDAVPG